MSNMTGLGRYQKGLELEKEGLSGAQIAAKLGYANAQGWYDAKYRYNNRTAAFNERAAETSAKTLPTKEVVSGETGKATSSGADSTLLQDAMATGMANASKEILQQTKELLQQKQQFAPAAIPAEKETPQPKGATTWDAAPSSRIKSKSIILEGALMVYRYGPDNLIHIDNRFSEDGGIVLQKSQLTEWIEELFEAVREMERIE